MLKATITFLFLLITITMAAQRPPVTPATMDAPRIANQGYWQQRVQYKMDIDFDDKKGQFEGKQMLRYTNNSPDDLNKVYYHLYFNAFQPNSMMDTRSRTIVDPDGRVKDRILHLDKKETGYHIIESLKYEGVEVEFKVEGTILEVALPKPIKPNTTVEFAMEFKSQVPKQIRRSGRNNKEGIDYSMTQWYPKMAEYDKEGWHANPYVGREFHGVWGDFDVTIHMKKDYVIGGTGVLQNPKEIGHGYLLGGAKPVEVDGKKLHWHFKAENVHDFAWAADPDYKHDIVKLDNGTRMHFFYQTDTLVENWVKMQEYAVGSFEYMNEHFGVYPYPQYSVIQGGDGGMEYPMCTLITSHGSLGGLISVTVHESIHSWYQGMLATNESKYPWMDEGFTTYAQAMTLDHLYEKNDLNPLSRSYLGYSILARSDDQEPLTTHADHYKKNRTYGISVYSKGGVFLHQLSYIIGKEAFQRGMLDYYNAWRFKHPTPDDFKRVMEKASGIELDWYMEQFIGTINTIDYAVKKVEKKGKSTMITLVKKGDMPMPLDVKITKTDGTEEWHYIPIRIMRGEKGPDLVKFNKTHEDWGWAYPSYDLKVDVPLKNIQKIEIDPSRRMADIYPKNNIFPEPESKEE
jgi:hypothetical protein